MPFCSQCGKEVSQDVSFCSNCGERLKMEGRSETHSGRNSKVVRFVIGLIVVGAICGLLFLIEDLVFGYPPPYDDPWAPKAAIGLLSVYGVAGLIYFTFAGR